jgi:GxxExxY protein
VDAACHFHTRLGPGLRESVYQVVLARELSRRGLQRVCRQAVPIWYEGMRLERGFRADLVIEDNVVVELKS